MSAPRSNCPVCTARLPPSGICVACELERALTAGAGEPGPPSTPPVEALPREFGEYHLVREIARGGMGVVYEARQVRAGRVVALKMISATAVSGLGTRQRFRIEAEAAARLDHPHIVTIHDVGEVGGTPFYSMRLVQGSDLAVRLVEGPLPARAAVDLMIPVARAVQHAHAHGILHRDLKPGNILLDAEGRPHLTDFGLAKVLRGDQDQPVTREIIGTPAYMAPEMTRANSTLTTASDVWALGAILYQCLTGRVPFPGESWIETFKGIANDEPAHPCPDDRQLGTIVLTCLRKDPDKRYRSAASLADDLERWRDRLPIQARPVSPAERLALFTRRHPAIAALSLVLLATVGVSAVLLTHEYRNKIQAKAEAERHSRDALSASLRAQTSERAARESLYFAQMGSAIRAREEGDFGLARRLLAGMEPALRGLEWRLLNHLCRGDDLPPEGARTGPFASFPQGDPPGAVAFRPDGSEIAVGLGANRVTFLHTQTAAPYRTLDLPPLPAPSLREPARLARHLRFSPDGRRFSYAIGDWLRVVETETGRQLLSLRHVQPQAEWLDNRRLLWGAGTWYSNPSEDNAVILEVDTLVSTPLAKGLSAPVAISGDRRRVALCRDLATLQVFDTADFNTPLVSIGNASLAVRLASLSFDGSSVGAYFGGGPLGGFRMGVYDVAGGAKLHELRQPAHIQALVMDPVSPAIHVASKDPSLRSHRYRLLWPSGASMYDDLAEWMFAQPVPFGGAFNPPARFLTRSALRGMFEYRLGHEHNLLDVAVDPVSKRLASLGADRTLRLWNPNPAAATLRRLADARIHPHVQEVAPSADGAWVLAGRVRPGLSLWKPGEGVVAHLSERLEPLACWPDGRQLVYRPRDGNCVLLRLDGTNLVETAAFAGLRPVPGFDQVRGARLLADGNTVVGAFPGVLFSIDTQARKAECTRDLVMRMGKANVQGFDVSPDGHWVVSTGLGISAQIRAVDDLGTLVAELRSGQDYDTAPAFSPDGQWVMVGNEDGTLRRWRVGSWKPEESDEPRVAHRGAITALCYSPDGSALLTSGGDDLRVWDVEPFRLRAVFPTGGPRHFLRFADRGNQLFHGGLGTPLEVWDAHR